MAQTFQNLRQIASVIDVLSDGLDYHTQSGISNAVFKILAARSDILKIVSNAGVDSSNDEDKALQAIGAIVGFMDISELANHDNGQWID